MVWQHRAWYSFVWICGDQIVEQHLHNIDAVNWFMGAHPVKAFASGGAAWRPRTEIYGNIYDHVDADFVYPNGVHMSSHCRQFPKGSYQNVSELIVGSKGRTNCKDTGGKGENPYVREHIALVKSIRGQGPYINDGMAVAESTMTCIMARESAYSGQEVTWDQMMAFGLRDDMGGTAAARSGRVQIRLKRVLGLYSLRLWCWVPAYSPSLVQHVDRLNRRVIDPRNELDVQLPLRVRPRATRTAYEKWPYRPLANKAHRTRIILRGVAGSTSMVLINGRSLLAWKRASDIPPYPLNVLEHSRVLCAAGARPGP